MPLQSTQNVKNTRASSRFFTFLVSFGKLRFPSFFSSKAIMAGDEGFDSKNESRFLCNPVKDWLGQIKQALTIYKEDIRNRLDNFNPES